MTLNPAEILPYLEYANGDGKTHSVVGNVQILPQVWSPQLEIKRDILVYLPPSYKTGERRYPVLYLQDGQNLFDDATAYGGQDWRVDETMERLSGDGYQAIVVGIYHGGEQRLVEYNPFPGKWSGKGEEYVAFLCDTLKPFIDSHFRTIHDAAATGILGSSMGGLISLFAFFRRPDVFGLCAAMSPSLFVGRGAILQYARQAQVNVGKIYLDNGTHEPSARPMLELLHEKGYRVKRDLKYVAEHGGKHTESAWARRLPGALRFLLKDFKTRKERGSSSDGYGY
jgi:predicted alpha/beta superfamily hydrolase